MCNLPERIKKARYECSLSVEQLAKELGEKGVKITSRTIYSYESAERQPSTTFLQALVDYYDINAQWLLAGRGDIFVDTTCNLQPANLNFSDVVFIPLLNLEPAAGHGTLIEERNLTKDYISFAKKTITDITVTDPRHLTMFSVKGDSMKGEIEDGDLIMINDTINELSQDGIYVVCIDDKLFVKILQKLPANKVRVVSANTKYPPFEVDLNTEYFKIIGKVIWRGGKI